MHTVQPDSLSVRAESSGEGVSINERYAALVSAHQLLYAFLLRTNINRNTASQDDRYHELCDWKRKKSRKGGMTLFVSTTVAS